MELNQRMNIMKYLINEKELLQKLNELDDEISHQIEFEVTGYVEKRSDVVYQGICIGPEETIIEKVIKYIKKKARRVIRKRNVILPDIDWLNDEMYMVHSR
jgi:hypothetical protein